MVEQEVNRQSCGSWLVGSMHLQLHTLRWGSIQVHATVLHPYKNTLLNSHV